MEELKDSSDEIIEEEEASSSSVCTEEDVVSHFNPQVSEREMKKIRYYEEMFTKMANDTSIKKRIDETTNKRGWKKNNFEKLSWKSLNATEDPTMKRKQGSTSSTNTSTKRDPPINTSSSTQSFVATSNNNNKSKQNSSTTKQSIRSIGRPPKRMESKGVPPTPSSVRVLRSTKDVKHQVDGRGRKRKEKNHKKMMKREVLESEEEPCTASRNTLSTVSSIRGKRSKRVVGKKKFESVKLEEVDVYNEGVETMDNSMLADQSTEEEAVSVATSIDMSEIMGRVEGVQSPSQRRECTSTGSVKKQRVLLRGVSDRIAESTTGRKKVLCNDVLSTTCDVMDDQFLNENKMSDFDGLHKENTTARGGDSTIHEGVIEKKWSGGNWRRRSKKRRDGRVGESATECSEGGLSYSSQEVEDVGIIRTTNHCSASMTPSTISAMATTFTPSDIKSYVISCCTLCPPHDWKAMLMGIQNTNSSSAATIEDTSMNRQSTKECMQPKLDTPACGTHPNVPTSTDAFTVYEATPSNPSVFDVPLKELRNELTCTSNTSNASNMVIPKNPLLLHWKWRLLNKGVVASPNVLHYKVC